MTTPIYELGDLVTIRKGKKAVEVSEGPSEGFLRYIQIEDLRNNDSMKYARNPKGPICDGNDVLIAWDGAKAGTVGFGLSGLVGSTIAILRPNESVHAPYLGMVLQSKYQIIRDACTGATIPHVSKPFLLRMKIPLPSISEQKRIASILDKANEIKYDSAKASEIRDEIIRSTFLDFFGDLTINPKGWKLVFLNDLVDKLGDGIHGTPVYDENGDYFFINGTNLRDKKIKILENTKRVNELEYLKHKKELNASTMFVSINGTVGNVAYYNGEPVMLGKSVCYFNVKESEVSKTYLYYLIKSIYFTNYARGNSTGSTIRNLSLKAMRNFPIPLPPINIQNEFEILIQNISEMGINLSMQNTELLSKSITQSLIG